VLLALVAAVLFGAGLSIIHGTLNLLFGLTCPRTGMTISVR
jgi:hypothetical protein